MAWNKPTGGCCGLRAASLTVCNPGPKWRQLAENRAALGFGAGGGSVGAIAQLGERVVRNDEVGGSIPPGSTIHLRRSFGSSAGKPARVRRLPAEALAKAGFLFLKST